ncbi:hypothetical protein [Sphingomonas crusticola]|uniref:hypothetical protein n=1 Tax=Sphingomonas crusticola TaxID=1697973 RepID=UPI000E28611E|nr:hypothetical protein [Sphingomonas crusticola]
MLVTWLLAQAAAAAAPATPPPTLQAQFEQATVALNADNWAEALAGFQAIEARPGISPRTRGIAMLRAGSALHHLQRDDQAKQAFAAGLQLVGQADATLNNDRLDAYLALGGIEKGAYDYVAARHDFEQALSLANDPTAKIQALLALITVTMFDDSAAALGYADAMMKVAETTKIAPEVDATLRDMRGRVLLNRGDYKGALAELEVALKDLGGLTTKTDLNDVTVRADLALASFLAGYTNKAREYFAMTGEGRLPAGPFAVAARTDLPACGGNLKPEDRAVVEFGIGTDGAVSYANPVYASRSGAVARELAEAVSGWSWKAGGAAKIPAFYRLATRVELRCSTAVQRPADLNLLWPQVAAWVGDAFPLHNDTAPNAAEASILRTSIATREAGAKDRALVGSLAMLASAPTTDRDESHDLYARAAAAASQLKAPPAVIAYLDLSSSSTADMSAKDGWKRYLAAVRAMLARPDIAADAQTAAVLRLILGSPMQSQGYAPDAEPALRDVIDDKRLDARDPLRVGALVRLSSFQAQQGQIDAARASFLKSGLDAQQCALVDAQPAIAKVGVGSNDYPAEMLMMRVSGWTQIELDVLPNGQTTNRRAVISYPPLMFGDATVKAMAKTRYTQSYRPDGALGCGGATQRFRYVVPQS